MRFEPATLRLEGYYLKEVSCAVRPGSEEETKLALVAGLQIQPPRITEIPPYTVTLEAESGKNKNDPHRYRVVISISSDETAEERTPYIFKLTIVGFFRWHASVNAPLTDIMVLQNASMILYSIGREILASITSRGPFPGLVLPTYTFVIEDELKQLDSEKGSARSPQRKEPKKPTKARTRPVSPAKKR